MAYGDKDNGTLFLYEVPTNLKSKMFISNWLKGKKEGRFLKC